MRTVLVSAWCAAALALAACSTSPTAPSDDVDERVTTPQSITFTGAVGPGGAASRTFTAALPGEATATISSIEPPTALVIALGVPRADGRGCLPARSAAATDGVAARVTAAVDAGTFCAQVLAPSDAAELVTFSVTLEHP